MSSGPLLKKREKRRTPSCFRSTFKEKPVTLSTLMWPTRPDNSGAKKILN